MFAEWIVAGTITYWVILLLVFGVCFFTIEEHASIVTFTVIGTIVFMTLFGDWRPLRIFAEPDVLLFEVVVYFILGTAWSFGKWWFYVNRIARTVEQLKANWYEQHSYTRDNVLNTNEYSDLMRTITYKTGELPPKVSKNKTRITTWITWWPFSLTWTLLNDPVVHLVDWIYRNVGSVMQSMSDSAFKNTFNDVKRS